MCVTDRNGVVIIDNLATGPARRRSSTSPGGVQPLPPAPCRRPKPAGSPSTPGRVEAGAGSRVALLGLGRSSTTRMVHGARRRSCFLRWPGRGGCQAWPWSGSPETSPGLSRWWSLPGTGSTGGSCPSECARPAPCRLSPPCP